MTASVKLSIVLWFSLVLGAAAVQGQSLLSIPPDGWPPAENGEETQTLAAGPGREAGGTGQGDGTSGEDADATAGEDSAGEAGPAQDGEGTGEGDGISSEASTGEDSDATAGEDSAAETAQTEADGTDEGGGDFAEDSPVETSEIPVLAPADPELRAALKMVDEGRGHEAYPILAARIPLELQRVRAEGEDVGEWEKRLLIPLLRAGEGLAPSQEQERVARRLIEEYPDAEQFPLAFFYLTRVLFAQDKPLPESFFFDDSALAQLAPWMQTSYLTMNSEAAAREGDFLAAAEFLLRESGMAAGLQSARPDDVRSLLQQVGDTEQLDEFLENHAEVEWLWEAGPFLRVRAQINAGEIAPALLGIDRILRDGLATTPEQIKAIHAARSEIEGQLLIAPRRIGVLLPLSSSSSALRTLSRDTLDGLRMVIRSSAGRPWLGGRGAGRAGGFDPALQAEPTGKARAFLQKRFELVVRDTGNKPRRAAQMVEQLATEENVIAIVGPIARSESVAAAEAAERLRVPLISLSLTMELPRDAGFVFRHSKSQQEEMRDMVRFAMDYAGARRFVLLYPETGYGKKITELFWAAVEEKGGRVVGAESYGDLSPNPLRRTGQVGLKKIFERFTGLDRPQEAEDIALQEAVGDSGATPILDFDAIFIPIGPSGSQDLRLIAPYPVTVDAENVLLLGNRFWNSDEVIVAGGGKLDGAVFVDAFDRMGMDPRLREFRRLHRIMFGHRVNFRPASYYTAFAYDTLSMLKLGVTKKGRTTRQSLAKWLVTMEPFPGVTGLTTFLESGEAVKESMFFRLERDQIRRITP